MPRLQLFELEDLTWFPRIIRDFATDYLHFLETRFALHKPIVPLLRSMLEETNSSSVVDLCSGGGGPVLALCQALTAQQFHVEFTLTDKYPNLPAFQHLCCKYPAAIRYVADPVNATEVPSTLVGPRTMFNAFHHFPPPLARLVLEDAVRAQQPIAIFELPERNLPMLLLFLFIPIMVFLITPFMRPFRWTRLLWTYLIPIVPLTCLWDGLVSACRAYTVAEMLALTNGLDTFAWTAQRIRLNGKPGHLTHLQGIPRWRSPSLHDMIPLNQDVTVSER